MKYFEILGRTWFSLFIVVYKHVFEMKTWWYTWAKFGRGIIRLFAKVSAL